MADIVEDLRSAAEHCPGIQFAKWGGRYIVNELKDAANEIERLRAEYRDLLALIQQYQPGGSPPPGSPYILTAWVLKSLLDGVKPAHWRPSHKQASDE